MTALRVLLVVAGLAVGFWAVERNGAVRGCDAAGRAAFRATSASDAVRAASRSERECRGSAPLASAAAVLLNRGYPAAARRLADEAIRREPENSAGWVAAGKIAQEGNDAAGLARARARLRTLDPRNRVLG